MWTLAGFTEYGVIVLPGILIVIQDESLIASDRSRIQLQASDVRDLVMETEAWLRSY
jgi:hypothetical protein